MGIVQFVRISAWARVVTCGMIVTSMAGGCDDPYSQHRIQRHTTHLNQTAYDIQQREESGARRMDEAGKALQKWWRSDCERFQRKAATIGDYIW